MDDIVGQRSDGPSRFSTGLTFMVGVCVGVLGATGIGVASDWVVTDEELNAEIQETRIEELGQACEAVVERDWRLSNRPMEDLRGWAYDNVRKDLARETLDWLSDDPAITDDAISICMIELRA